MLLFSSRRIDHHNNFDHAIFYCGGQKTFLLNANIFVRKSILNNILALEVK